MVICIKGYLNLISLLRIGLIIKKMDTASMYIILQVKNMKEPGKMGRGMVMELISLV
jgi:hypothetical protein